MEYLTFSAEKCWTEASAVLQIARRLLCTVHSDRQAFGMGDVCEVRAGLESHVLRIATRNEFGE